jgi:hypothetical protein
MEKNHSPSWRVSLKNNSPIPNSTRIWQVGEWLFPPLMMYINKNTLGNKVDTEENIYSSTMKIER